MADGGYDIADYEGVRPEFGTLADVDALIAEAHRLGLKVLLDAVPCHTSIEHPWFRDRPDFYVWSDRDGPQNNWRSTFGGPAWSPDPHGRGWYLHSFYPEQPDLDWRNPEVGEAFGAALRFWLDRGVDGFRLDALDRLLKDPQRRDDRVRHAGSPLVLPETDPEYAQLEHDRSRNAPDIGTAVAQLRAAVGRRVPGGGGLPAQRGAGALPRPTSTPPSPSSCFQAPWTAAAVRDALRASAALGEGRAAWVLSNHDFPRLPQRVGARNVRAAALLLLSLPGAAFVFQGDEIGMGDGPGRPPGTEPDDRSGRDAHRHPMAWDATEPRRLHDRHPVAARRRPGRRQRRRPGARPRLAAAPLPRPDRAAARHAARAAGADRRHGAGRRWPSRAATRTSSRSTSATRRRRRRRRAPCCATRTISPAPAPTRQRWRPARGSSPPPPDAPGSGVASLVTSVTWACGRVLPPRHDDESGHLCPGACRSGPCGGRLWRKRQPAGSGDPELVHLQRAQRRRAGRGQAVLGRLQRGLQHQVPVPALPGRRAARAARPAPRGRGRHARPARPRRRLDGRVRQRRVDRAGARRDPARGDQGRLPERAQHRALRGSPLRRADLVQHPAALVSQGPGQGGAQDLGADDQDG